MKHYPKLEMYKASNVTFSTKTLKSYSYNWWQFTAPVKTRKGDMLLVILNSFPYSNTTQRHQLKVRRILQELELPYLELEVPAGLQSGEALESTLAHYGSKIEKLQKEMIKGRKIKNIERELEISKLMGAMARAKQLLPCI